MPIVFSRVEESKATFPKTKDVSFFCADHANQSVCASLVAGRQTDRQGGREEGGRIGEALVGAIVTLSESDTSSILCIFLAPARHA